MPHPFERVGQRRPTDADIAVGGALRIDEPVVVALLLQCRRGALIGGDPVVVHVTERQVPIQIVLVDVEEDAQRLDRGIGNQHLARVVFPRTQRIPQSFGSLAVLLVDERSRIRDDEPILVGGEPSLGERGRAA